MRMDKSKTMIIAVIALVVVCAGSFFAVRSINSRVKPTAVTVSSMAPVASDDSTVPTDDSVIVTDDSVIATDDSTYPTFETAEPLDTVPLSQTPEDTSDSGRFTTFPVSTTASTTSFTLPTEGTTIYTPTTQTPTTQSAEEQAQETIERAAVFSDGFLGYQYNKEGNYYFTTTDPWQRNFGFNVLYDMGAPFVNFYYDTVRCKFRYQNKDWLIQFWKGQYGLVFLGAEIGVYTKPLDREQAHYDGASDDDMLYMSMSFYRKGEERATREYAKYWWCTAFVPGTLDSFRDRSELSMKSRITLKTAEMRDLFVASLEGNGFKKDKDFSVSGKDVFFSW